MAETMWELVDMDYEALTVAAQYLWMERDRLEAENGRLRALVGSVRDFIEDVDCDDCPSRRDCGDNNRMFCADSLSYHAFSRMRRLGIEVEK